MFHTRSVKRIEHRDRHADARSAEHSDWILGHIRQYHPEDVALIESHPRQRAAEAFDHLPHALVSVFSSSYSALLEISR